MSKPIQDTDAYLEAHLQEYRQKQAKAEAQVRRQAYDQLQELFCSLGVIIGDVEPVYDEKNQRIRLIDAGGFTLLPKLPQTPQERADHQAKNHSVLKHLLYL